MPPIDELIQALRSLVHAGEFAEAEKLLAKIPELLLAEPPREREVAARWVLKEMREWQQVVKVQRAHLTEQWLRLQHRDLYRRESVPRISLDCEG